MDRKFITGAIKVYVWSNGIERESTPQDVWVHARGPHTQCPRALLDLPQRRLCPSSSVEGSMSHARIRDAELIPRRSMEAYCFQYSMLDEEGVAYMKLIGWPSEIYRGSNTGTK